MPPHLVPLGSGSWSLWKWVWLRGTGFAARPILGLGSDALVAQLDAEDAADDRLDRAQRAAIEACTAAASASPPAQAMKAAIGRVRERRLPSRATGDAGADAAIEAYRQARAELAAARARTVDIVKAARTQAAEALLRIARDPRFREALIWQNRSVLGNAVDRLLDTAPEVDDAKARERQRLVARYAQRYLLKNDSIGFFGPIGWGTFDPGEPGLIATPDERFVDRRVVSFEDWALNNVATQISQDLDVREVITPRRRAASWLDGNMLHMPPAAPRALTATETWLVARVDGERSLPELAAEAAREPASGLPTVDDAMTELERLGREQVISWGIEVPAELDRPEHWLRERLARITDPDIRARAIEPLDRIEAARDKVSQAAGAPDALDAAVAGLEDEFQDVTGLSPKRGHGRTYAGRQTFFEDCRRAVDARFGRVVLDALGDPLTLILHSARWFSYEIARRFRAGFDEVYDRELAASATRPLPLTMFFAGVRRLFSPDHYQTGPIVTVVQRELQQRWAEVLGITREAGAARSLVLRADACRARVAELFDAPGPGWPRARYHSPDVMINAASIDHIARGDFVAVLGEVHPGLNSLLSHVAIRLHPERAMVERAYEDDTAMACISTVQGAIGRVTSTPLSLRDHHVEVGPTRSWRPRDHVHLAGDLYVERIAGRLRVKSRVRELDHDIISFMEPYLAVETAPHFKLLPREPHLPRVMIDKLVVSRERWNLQRPEFEALAEEVGDAAVAVRRVWTWAKRLGLPRYVFATVPHEPKPFYVDLSSTIFIDNFLHLLPKAATLGLSEMLPGHDGLWLLDAAGSPYACELRLAAVDPRRWSPGSGAL